MTTALIDGDVVAYIAAFSAQHTFYYVTPIGKFGSNEAHLRPSRELAELDLTDGFEVVSLVIPEVREHILKKIVNNIMDAIFINSKTDDFRLFLTPSDKSNFRCDIATIKPYKGNRKAKKPQNLKFMRDYLIDVYNGELAVEEEADDLLGKNQTEQTIICSIDKDLKMIPGNHYNIRTYELSRVTKKQAILNFYGQLLTGDTVDNIQGIPGIGKVRAANILAKCGNRQEVELAICKAYKEYYKDGWENILDEMCDLLWIRQKEHVEFRINEDIKGKV